MIEKDVGALVWHSFRKWEKSKDVAAIDLLLIVAQNWGVIAAIRRRRPPSIKNGFSIKSEF